MTFAKFQKQKQRKMLVFCEENNKIILNFTTFTFFLLLLVCLYLANIKYFRLICFGNIDFVYQKYFVWLKCFLLYVILMRGIFVLIFDGFRGFTDRLVVAV